ncbi:hypothetical protein ABLN87_21945 [Ruegeria sp. SCPT10]|uniref:hypothetical protein n=1 Tax=Ruegeria sp. SCP10 TaxID=3141377 RepID=UPI0033377EE1
MSGFIKTIASCFGFGVGTATPREERSHANHDMAVDGRATNRQLDRGQQSELFNEATSPNRREIGSRSSSFARHMTDITETGPSLRPSLSAQTQQPFRELAEISKAPTKRGEIDGGNASAIDEEFDPELNQEDGPLLSRNLVKDNAQSSASEQGYDASSSGSSMGDDWSPRPSSQLHPRINSQVSFQRDARNHIDAIVGATARSDLGEIENAQRGLLSFLEGNGYRVRQPETHRERPVVSTMDSTGPESSSAQSIPVADHVQVTENINQISQPAPDPVLKNIRDHGLPEYLQKITSALPPEVRPVDLVRLIRMDQSQSREIGGVKFDEQVSFLSASAFKGRHQLSDKVEEIRLDLGHIGKAILAESYSKDYGIEIFLLDPTDIPGRSGETADEIHEVLDRYGTVGLLLGSDGNEVPVVLSIDDEESVIVVSLEPSGDLPKSVSELSNIMSSDKEVATVQYDQTRLSGVFERCSDAIETLKEALLYPDELIASARAHANGEADFILPVSLLKTMDMSALDRLPPEHLQDGRISITENLREHVKKYELPLTEVSTLVPQQSVSEQSVFGSQFLADDSGRIHTLASLQSDNPVSSELHFRRENHQLWNMQLSSIALEQIDMASSQLAEMPENEGERAEVLAEMSLRRNLLS